MRFESLRLKNRSIKKYLNNIVEKIQEQTTKVIGFLENSSATPVFSWLKRNLRSTLKQFSM